MADEWQQKEFGLNHAKTLDQSICSTTQKSDSEGEKIVCGGEGSPEGQGHERNHRESVLDDHGCYRGFAVTRFVRVGGLNPPRSVLAMVPRSCDRSGTLQPSG